LIKVDAGANGRLSKELQISRVANSVSPPVATAIVAANCNHLIEYKETAEYRPPGMIDITSVCRKLRLFRSGNKFVPGILRGYPTFDCSFAGISSSDEARPASMRAHILCSSISASNGPLGTLRCQILPLRVCSIDC
jgi:hypothetical protein